MLCLFCPAPHLRVILRCQLQPLVWAWVEVLRLLEEIPEQGQPDCGLQPLFLFPWHKQPCQTGSMVSLGKCSASFRVHLDTVGEQSCCCPVWGPGLVPFFMAFLGRWFVQAQQIHHARKVLTHHMHAAAQHLHNKPDASRRC